MRAPPTQPLNDAVGEHQEVQGDGVYIELLTVERHTAHRLVGANWRSDGAPEIAKNSYRVLLTRARKGLVLFVPPGDLSGNDESRPKEAYDAIASFLAACGATLIDRDA